MERVSGLYAKVCLELAVKSKSLSAVHSDVLRLQTLIHNSNHVFTANSVLFDVKKRREFYAMLVQYGKFNKITNDVMRLMQDYNHFVYMKGFTENFIKMYRKFTGFVEARIVSAEKIDKKFIDPITELLAAKFKHKIILKKVVEPEMLGGMRVEIGSYVIDNTVANKLRRLKLEIIK